MTQGIRWLGLVVVALAVAMPAVAQRQPGRSPHGPLTIPCENCHTNTSWTPIRAIPEFNHDSTRYPLRGMHEKVSCTGCHIKPVFTDVGKQCANCHADIHRAQFGSNCAQCHTVLGWQVSVQSIQQHFNRFPLLGAHAVVECQECHKNAAVGNYLGLSTACSSCHQADWQRTTNPVHPSAGAAFAAANCTTCHSFDNWANAKFDHSTTGFLLTNGHANVACALCHISNNYNLTIAPTDCGNSGCHLTTWQTTTNPVHPSAGTAFAAANCTGCHNTISWTTATFDHSTTGFPLTSGHANVACTLCHINNNYNLTIAASACGNSQCHLTTWQQTNTPVHSTAGAAFGAANCATCHTTAGWTAAAFDHSVTGFTLTGKHMSPTPTPCASCHVSNNYTLNSGDCYGCHQSEFLSTRTIGGAVPNHVAAGFPTTAAACAMCHPITVWSAGAFNHAAVGFPLTNSHAAVACALCHVNGNYSLNIAPTACGTSGCHLTTWQNTNAPSHSAAGATFAAANCSSCHTTVSFNTSTFNHTTMGFALTGMHISPSPTPCLSCHVGNNFTLNSKACMGCHLANWQSTATIGGAVPNHITAGFPQDCSFCHSTTNWTSATFNHNTTGFPLTGAHTSVTCALCHVGGNYSGTLPTDCYNCHIAQWQSTTTLGGSVPNHITSGYPTTCASCHTTTSWLGAVFNHATTGFPLTGAHITTACTLCHISTAKPPIDCYSCHTAAWQSTATLGGAVPNHLAADASAIGIVTTSCASCHTTTNWLGATFTHSFFPLTHGGNAANGICANCHTSPSTTYTAFQCTGCHGGNNAANFNHRPVGGYVYNSVACYGCHRNAP
jgi:hypothetical protein